MKKMMFHPKKRKEGFGQQCENKSRLYVSLWDLSADKRKILWWMRASTISVSKYKATDSMRTHTTQRSLITYQQSSAILN